MFDQCQLHLYNNKCAEITAQYEANGDKNVKPALAEYHRNFIKDHCYINIGQLMKKIMKQIAGDINSSIVEQGKYQQCARTMFFPELHDSSQYFTIRLSCKDHELIYNRLLIENVYIICLECDSEVSVNINKDFAS